MKGLCVLGSTGSIGVSTLDVAGRHPDQYRVIALTANGNWERLAEQCEAFRPAYAVMIDPGQADRLKAALKAK
ncbi:MAG TPA: 1-deoxy-D-xylulose-5-phosphate reductoisomerase, partial [Methylococcaceae bacterium]|nr:1-deoxy-D-xylulose-5-phosphate reductoisomerase [Methylococcaceae bacterium]